MSFEFVALSPLLLHCLRGSVARRLTPATPVLAPLHEVVSIWQGGPIIMPRFLLGNRAQGPFAIDLDLLYDVDASHGTIRIPWFANGNQKSDSKLDSKEGKLLILLGLFRKLAFYQLNYSRSMIPFKYRRIRAFTATAISTSLGIQILVLQSHSLLFSMATQLMILVVDSKVDSKQTWAPCMPALAREGDFHLKMENGRHWSDRHPRRRSIYDGIDCEEKKRFLTEYEAATTKFASAVTDLQRNMGTSPKAEYDRLQPATDEARVKSEQARLAVEEHVATHQC